MKAIRHARGLNKGLFGFILLALLLALALLIGNAGVAQAQPGAVTITDSFEDETRIAFKENVAVDTIAGQVELSPVLSATYGGGSSDEFESVYANGDYIYAAGRTSSEGQGGYDTLLVKFNKADLSIAARKVYGGSKHDYFYSVYTDSNYIYAAGYTGSEGQGSDDALLVKFNISDLSIASRKVYGGGSSDYFYSVYTDSNYIYAAGNTDSEGEGEQDALLVKFNISLPSGTYTGCGFTFQDSALTLADSNRTLADSTLTLAVCSISGPQPPVGVGGEAYPVNKLAILIPWIGLIAALLAGATIVILRFRLLRRRSSSQ